MDSLKEELLRELVEEVCNKLGLDSISAYSKSKIRKLFRDFYNPTVPLVRVKVPRPNRPIKKNGLQISHGHNVCAISRVSKTAHDPGIHNSRTTSHKTDKSNSTSRSSHRTPFKTRLKEKEATKRAIATDRIKEEVDPMIEKPRTSSNGGENRCQLYREMFVDPRDNYQAKTGTFKPVVILKQLSSSVNKKVPEVNNKEKHPRSAATAKDAPSTVLTIDRPKERTSDLSRSHKRPQDPGKEKSRSPTKTNGTSTSDVDRKVKEVSFNIKAEGSDASEGESKDKQAPSPVFTPRKASRTYDKASKKSSGRKARPLDYEDEWDTIASVEPHVPPTPHISATEKSTERPASSRISPIHPKGCDRIVLKITSTKTTSRQQPSRALKNNIGVTSEPVVSSKSSSVGQCTAINGAGVNRPGKNQPSAPMETSKRKSRDHKKKKFSNNGSVTQLNGQAVVCSVDTETKLDTIDSITANTVLEDPLKQDCKETLPPKKPHVGPGKHMITDNSELTCKKTDAGPMPIDRTNGVQSPKPCQKHRLQDSKAAVPKKDVGTPKSDRRRRRSTRPIPANIVQMVQSKGSPNKPSALFSRKRQGLSTDSPRRRRLVHNKVIIKHRREGQVSGESSDTDLEHFTSDDEFDACPTSPQLSPIGKIQLKHPLRVYDKENQDLDIQTEEDNAMKAAGLKVTVCIKGMESCREPCHAESITQGTKSAAQNSVKEDAVVPKTRDRENRAVDDGEVQIAESESSPYPGDSPTIHTRGALMEPLTTGSSTAGPISASLALPSLNTSLIINGGESTNKEDNYIIKKHRGEEANRNSPSIPILETNRTSNQVMLDDVKEEHIMQKDKPRIIGSIELVIDTDSLKNESDLEDYPGSVKQENALDREHHFSQETSNSNCGGNKMDKNSAVTSRGSIGGVETILNTTDTEKTLVITPGKCTREDTISGYINGSASPTKCFQESMVDPGQHIQTSDTGTVCKTPTTTTESVITSVNELVSELPKNDDDSVTANNIGGQCVSNGNAASVASTKSMLSDDGEENKEVADCPVLFPYSQCVYSSECALTDNSTDDHTAEPDSGAKSTGEVPDLTIGPPIIYPADDCTHVKHTNDHDVKCNPDEIPEIFDSEPLESNNLLHLSVDIAEATKDTSNGTDNNDDNELSKQNFEKKPLSPPVEKPSLQPVDTGLPAQAKEGETPPSISETICGLKNADRVSSTSEPTSVTAVTDVEVKSSDIAVNSKEIDHQSPTCKSQGLAGKKMDRSLFLNPELQPDSDALHLEGTNAAGAKPQSEENSFGVDFEQHGNSLCVENALIENLGKKTKERNHKKTKRPKLHERNESRSMSSDKKRHHSSHTRKLDISRTHTKEKRRGHSHTKGTKTPPKNKMDRETIAVDSHFQEKADKENFKKNADASIINVVKSVIEMLVDNTFDDTKDAADKPDKVDSYGTGEPGNYDRKDPNQLKDIEVPREESFYVGKHLPTDTTVIPSSLPNVRSKTSTEEHSAPKQQTSGDRSTANALDDLKFTSGNTSHDKVLSAEPTTSHFVQDVNHDVHDYPESLPEANNMDTQMPVTTATIEYKVKENTSVKPLRENTVDTPLPVKSLHPKTQFTWSSYRSNDNRQPLHEEHEQFTRDCGHAETRVSSLDRPEMNSLLTSLATISFNSEDSCQLKVLPSDNSNGIESKLNTDMTRSEAVDGMCTTSNKQLLDVAFVQNSDQGNSTTSFDQGLDTPSGQLSDTVGTEDSPVIKPSDIQLLPTAPELTKRGHLDDEVVTQLSELSEKQHEQSEPVSVLPIPSENSNRVENVDNNGANSSYHCENLANNKNDGSSAKYKNPNPCMEDKDVENEHEFEKQSSEMPYLGDLMASNDVTESPVPVIKERNVSPIEEKGVDKSLEAGEAEGEDLLPLCSQKTQGSKFYSVVPLDDCVSANVQTDANINREVQETVHALIKIITEYSQSQETGCQTARKEINEGNSRKDIGGTGEEAHDEEITSIFAKLPVAENFLCANIPERWATPPTPCMDEANTEDECCEEENGGTIPIAQIMKVGSNAKFVRVALTEDSLKGTLHQNGKDQAVERGDSLHTHCAEEEDSEVDFDFDGDWIVMDEVSDDDDEVPDEKSSTVRVTDEPNDNRQVEKRPQPLTTRENEKTRREKKLGSSFIPRSYSPTLVAFEVLDTLNFMVDQVEGTLPNSCSKQVLSMTPETGNEIRVTLDKGAVTQRFDQSAVHGEVGRCQSPSYFSAIAFDTLEFILDEVDKDLYSDVSSDEDDINQGKRIKHTVRNGTPRRPNKQSNIIGSGRKKAADFFDDDEEDDANSLFSTQSNHTRPEQSRSCLRILEFVETLMGNKSKVAMGSPATFDPSIFHSIMDDKVVESLLRSAEKPTLWNNKGDTVPSRDCDSMRSVSQEPHREAEDDRMTEEDPQDILELLFCQSDNAHPTVATVESDLLTDNANLPVTTVPSPTLSQCSPLDIHAKIYLTTSTETIVDNMVDEFLTESIRSYVDDRNARLAIQDRHLIIGIKKENAPRTQNESDTNDTNSLPTEECDSPFSPVLPSSVEDSGPVDEGTWKEMPTSVIGLDNVICNSTEDSHSKDLQLDSHSSHSDSKQRGQESQYEKIEAETMPRETDSSGAIPIDSDAANEIAPVRESIATNEMSSAPVIDSNTRTEMSSSPVTDINAMNEMSCAPATDSDVTNEFSSTPVIDNIATNEMSTAPVAARDATKELSSASVVDRDATNEMCCAPLTNSCATNELSSTPAIDSTVTHEMPGAQFIDSGAPDETSSAPVTDSNAKNEMSSTHFVDSDATKELSSAPVIDTDAINETSSPPATHINTNELSSAPVKSQSLPLKKRVFDALVEKDNTDVSNQPNEKIINPPFQEMETNGLGQSSTSQKTGSSGVGPVIQRDVNNESSCGSKEITKCSSKPSDATGGSQLIARENISNDTSHTGRRKKANPTRLLDNKSMHTPQVVSAPPSANARKEDSPDVLAKDSVEQPCGAVSSFTSPTAPAETNIEKVEINLPGGGKHVGNDTGDVDLPQKNQTPNVQQLVSLSPPKTIIPHEAVKDGVKRTPNRAVSEEIVSPGKSIKDTGSYDAVKQTKSPRNLDGKSGKGLSLSGSPALVKQKLPNQRLETETSQRPSSLSYNDKYSFWYVKTGSSPDEGKIGERTEPPKSQQGTGKTSPSPRCTVVQKNLIPNMTLTLKRNSDLTDKGNGDASEEALVKDDEFEKVLNKLRAAFHRRLQESSMVVENRVDRALESVCSLSLTPPSNSQRETKQSKCPEETSEIQPKRSSISKETSKGQTSIPRRSILSRLVSKRPTQRSKGHAKTNRSNNAQRKLLVVDGDGQSFWPTDGSNMPPPRKRQLRPRAAKEVLTQNEASAEIAPKKPRRGRTPKMAKPNDHQKLEHPEYVSFHEIHEKTGNINLKVKIKRKAPLNGPRQRTSGKKQRRGKTDTLLSSIEETIEEVMRGTAQEHVPPNKERTELPAAKKVRANQPTKIQFPTLRRRSSCAMSSCPDSDDDRLVIDFGESDSENPVKSVRFSKKDDGTYALVQEPTDKELAAKTPLSENMPAGVGKDTVNPGNKELMASTKAGVLSLSGGNTNGPSGVAKDQLAPRSIDIPKQPSAQPNATVQKMPSPMSAVCPPPIPVTRIQAPKHLPRALQRVLPVISAPAAIVTPSAIRSAVVKTPDYPTSQLVQILTDNNRLAEEQRRVHASSRPQTPQVSVPSQITAARPPAGPQSSSPPDCSGDVKRGLLAKIVQSKVENVSPVSASGEAQNAKGTSGPPETGIEEMYTLSKDWERTKQELQSLRSMYQRKETESNAVDEKIVQLTKDLIHKGEILSKMLEDRGLKSPAPKHPTVGSGVMSKIPDQGTAEKSTTSQSTCVKSEEMPLNTMQQSFVESSVVLQAHDSSLSKPRKEEVGIPIVPLSMNVYKNTASPPPKPKSSHSERSTFQPPMFSTTSLYQSLGLPLSASPLMPSPVTSTTASISSTGTPVTTRPAVSARGQSVPPTPVTSTSRGTAPKPSKTTLHPVDAARQGGKLGDEHTRHPAFPAALPLVRSGFAGVDPMAMFRYPQLFTFVRVPFSNAFQMPGPWMAQPTPGASSAYPRAAVQPPRTPVPTGSQNIPSTTEVPQPPSAHRKEVPQSAPVRGPPPAAHVKPLPSTNIYHQRAEEARRQKVHNEAHVDSAQEAANGGDARVHSGRAKIIEMQGREEGLSVPAVIPPVTRPASPGNMAQQTTRSVDSSPAVQGTAEPNVSPSAKYAASVLVELARPRLAPRSPSVQTPGVTSGSSLTSNLHETNTMQAMSLETREGPTGRGQPSKHRDSVQLSQTGLGTEPNERLPCSLEELVVNELTRQLIGNRKSPSTGKGHSVQGSDQEGGVPRAGAGRGRSATRGRKRKEPLDQLGVLEDCAKRRKGDLQDNSPATGAFPAAITAKIGCALCGKPAIFVCSGCQMVAYCSTECQAASWKNHYKQCKG